jgi:2-oxoisovalerate dehydrogenase E2 component (dihydrolipoyl transacylase)
MADQGFAEDFEEVVATEMLAMPQLGESVTEGTIVRWLKGTGDQVVRDELLLEVETEKVSVEIPSPFQGVLQRILIAEGETVAVGTVLAEFETSRLDTASVEPSGGDSQAISQRRQSTESVLVKEPSTAIARQYSPVVLLLAREHGIDLTEVQGTGDGGRVTPKEDVLEFAKSRQTELTQSGASEFTSSREVDAGPTPPPASVGDDAEAPRTLLMHQASGAQLTATVQSIPQAWMMVEVDVTELMRRCEEVRASVRQREGFELTHLPFIIKSVAAALKKFPRNSS